MILRTSYHDATNQRNAPDYLGNKDNSRVTSCDVKRIEAIFLLLYTLSVGKSTIAVEGTEPSGSVNGVCGCRKDT
jgi:hypothetical protein